MDTRRLILVLIFTFSSFMLWENWQKYNQPKPADAVAAAQVAGTAPTPSAALQAKAAPGAPSVVAPASTAETFTITTDLLKATISAQGGDLVSLELLNYKEHDNNLKNFDLFDAKHRYMAQAGLIGEGLPTHRANFKHVNGATALADGANELKVRLESTEQNGIKVAKILTFKRGSYLIDVAWEVANGSDKAIAPHAYFQLQRDDAAPAGETAMVSTFTGPAVFTDAEKYQKIDFSSIADNKAKFTKTADNGWLAMVQHYFVSAWVPADKTQREFYMRKVEGSNVFQAGVIVPIAEIAPGAKGETSVGLYAGPQLQSALKQVASGLDLVVDYGWLTVVAAPIFWALEAIHKLVGNWGWAIVVLTIIIKAIFFPLSAASYRSMAKMKVLTPRLTQLKERFGDDKQRMNQEMMKLYQTEKVNPLGGCLPILVQIPVFIALYWVLLGAVEMRGAPWILWIKDLASADPYYILPVIMMVSMFVQTKLNPTPPDPIQAKVMMMMPLIFGFMFFWFPAGLVLYWVVNNVLSIAQQWQITRLIDAGGKAANDAKA
ncbi:membrane protein insertase YidC [Ferribacterium limneticum]|uniref:membrane protein insertase YidC n=1 Tax=Ferribacterium limneticum TaxID=76259 RepID=UPI001CFA41A2|nr:membrane protein insertase YidC [Ferribacterium limneticum]UCV28536.1 membrane protein insertase YidC [Ferribacterium limneticum]UCV32453.1 membrane protein insertase YidC [Ferribacterium limneticum]